MYNFPSPFYNSINYNNFSRTQNKKNNVFHNSNQINNHKSHCETAPVLKECSKDKSSEHYEPLFELFGIKIYFDDVLIICILLFLYEEGIKDQYLFISLILLLLN